MHRTANISGHHQQSVGSRFRSVEEADAVGSLHGVAKRLFK